MLIYSINLGSSGGGGGGTPGGTDTQVQFNDGSAFGGSSKFTFVKATGEVTLTPVGATTSGVINIDSSGLTGASRGFRFQGTVPAGQNFGGTRVLLFNTTGSGTIFGHSVTILDDGGINTAFAQGYSAIIQGQMSGQGLSPFISVTLGNIGHQASVSAATTTGGSIALAGYSHAGNLNVGAHIYVDGAVGTTPKNYGVRSIVSNSGSAQAVAFYGKLGTTDGATLEGSTASASAVAVFDNGDTTSDILRLHDGGTVRLTVADGGTIVFAPVKADTIGFSYNAAGLTGDWSRLIDITGATFPTGSSARGINLELLVSTSSNRFFYANRIIVNGAGVGTNNIVAGANATVSGSNSGNSLSLLGANTRGNFGYVTDVSNTDATGLACGIISTAFSSKFMVAGAFHALDNNSATGTSVGVHGIATRDAGGVGVAVYGRINTLTTLAVESDLPTVSAAAVFDNGDTTSDLLRLHNNNVVGLRFTDSNDLRIAEDGTPANILSVLVSGANAKLTMEGTTTKTLFVQSSGTTTASIHLVTAASAQSFKITQTASAQVEFLCQSASGAIVPGDNAGHSLGASTLSWARIFAASGTAALPSYTFGAAAADTDNGFFCITGTDTIGVSTAGTSRATISTTAINTSLTLEMTTNASIATAADVVALGGFDIAAGRRTLAIGTEELKAVDVAVVSTHSFTVRWNGEDVRIPVAIP